MSLSGQIEGLNATLQAFANESLGVDWEPQHQPLGRWISTQNFVEEESNSRLAVAKSICVAARQVEPLSLGNRFDRNIYCMVKTNLCSYFQAWYPDDMEIARRACFVNGEAAEFDYQEGPKDKKKSRIETCVIQDWLYVRRQAMNACRQLSKDLHELRAIRESAGALQILLAGGGTTRPPEFTQLLPLSAASRPPQPPSPLPIAV